MLWTGFAMLVADRQFGAYVHLVPAGVWNALQLTGHGTQGRAWHLGLAIVFALNALFYAVTSLARGTWRRIVPRRAWLGEAWTATLLSGATACARPCCNHLNADLGGRQERFDVSMFSCASANSAFTSTSGLCTKPRTFGSRFCRPFTTQTRIALPPIV